MQVLYWMFVGIWGMSAIFFLKGVWEYETFWTALTRVVGTIAIGVGLMRGDLNLFLGATLATLILEWIACTFVDGRVFVSFWFRVFSNVVTNLALFVIISLLREQAALEAVSSF